MGGFGKVMLYTRTQRKVDVLALCEALRRMEVSEPIDSMVWRRYPGKSLKRLRELGGRTDDDPGVWDEVLEINDMTQFVFHKEVLFDAVPDLVRTEPSWKLTFDRYPFGDRLPQEWKSIPESIRGKTNDYGCGLTVGPHVQPIILPDATDFATVLVPEASFSMHFSGYPYKTAEAFDAMKSLPTLQLVRQRLEPVLGPLEIEATWSF